MQKYKVYSPLVLTMGLLIYLLNHCTKISLCAFVYTLLLSTAHVVSNEFGFKRAFQIILALVGFNLFFLSDYVYHTHGNVYKHMIPVSLFAVLVSSSIFIKSVTTLHKNKIDTSYSVFFGLIVASLVDGLIMSAYLVNYLSLSSVTFICFKEILFKSLYALIILTSIKIMHKKKQHRLTKIDLQRVVS